MQISKDHLTSDVNKYGGLTLCISMHVNRNKSLMCKGVVCDAQHILGWFVSFLIYKFDDDYVI